MITRKDNRERIQPVSCRGEKTPAALPQQKEQQKSCAEIEERERRAQKNAKRNSSAVPRAEQERLNFTDKRRMVRAWIDMVVTDQSEVTYVAGVTFPDRDVL